MEIIRENQEKDTKFKAVFNSHFDILFSYGMKIVNNNDLVKDAIQELFFRIWKNEVDLNKVSNMKAYLLRGLRNQLINLSELKSWNTQTTEVTDAISIEFSPEDYLIISQEEIKLQDKINNTLNKLSAKQREAIYFRYFLKMEYAEIADIMHINIQSVKNNVSRGIESMRDLLGMILLYYLLNLLLIKA